MNKLFIAAALTMAAVTACSTGSNQKVSFVPGAYEVSTDGYGGPMSLEVSFNANSIADIKVLSEKETSDIGHTALPAIIKRIIKANGTGIDAVTGATTTSNAVISAVQEAAKLAGVSDYAAFESNRAKISRPKAVKDSWDIVVVGAGGAGLAAAAQAAQDGNTVLVIEKNADLGGNTVISGGAYQSVIPYLVWDRNDPDATTGTGLDGQSYTKEKAVAGNLETLRMLLNWSEKEFDEDYYKTHEFVAGDAESLSKNGVHAEYLPTLLALKDEIREYLAWADKKMARGAHENQLTLFSTVNLHIFQTYYGGLRPSADGSEWCYSNAALVRQMVEEGQDIKRWMTSMGVEFDEHQGLIVGSLWYRATRMVAGNVTIGGQQTRIEGNKGTYIMAPYASFINANEHNTLMTLTTAESLIVKDGRVVGVKAKGENGQKVTAMANKGVIIATGGFAANISKVIENNKYWSADYVTPLIKTTNRGSMLGDGIEMGQKVGADVTGMGWTQLMPLSFADNGSIAFGGVDNAVFLTLNTGKRFVDETLERDVLSLSEFRNGGEMFGSKGAVMYLAGEHSYTKSMGPKLGDRENGQYTVTVDELPALFEKFGIKADPQTVVNSIKEYDMAIMDGKVPADAPKSYATALIGMADKRADGSYVKSTYTLDGVKLWFRILAPATHHTMGGLVIDEQRHVLDASGAPIPGLYAAGEVTGGLHGGNRLGGNALTDVLVSGRTAARSASAQQ